MNTGILTLMDFYRCPHTGQLIESMKSDDKVFCSCGKPNSKCPSEAPHHHVKRFLERVTAEQYLEEKQKNRAR